MLERGPLGRAKPALVRGFIVSTLKRLVEDGVSRDEAERLAAAFRAGAAMHVTEFRSVAAEPGFPTPCSAACAAGGGRRVLRLLALFRMSEPQFSRSFIRSSSSSLSALRKLIWPTPSTTHSMFLPSLRVLPPTSPASTGTA